MEEDSFRLYLAERVKDLNWEGNGAYRVQPQTILEENKIKSDECLQPFPRRITRAFQTKHNEHFSFPQDASNQVEQQASRCLRQQIYWGRIRFAFRWFKCSFSCLSRLYVRSRHSHIHLVCCSYIRWLISSEVWFIFARSLFDWQRRYTHKLFEMAWLMALPLHSSSDTAIVRFWVDLLILGFYPILLVLISRIWMICSISWESFMS